MTTKTATPARALSKVYENLRHFFTHRTALAVGLTFAMDSLMFGSWVTRIPFVKTQLGLNDAELGIALFGMPLGLLVMNPFSARFIERFGLAQATVWSAVALVLSMALPVWMPERWSLMAALFLTGLSIAVMNVGMNTCATNIERAEKIYVMSSCHGMWSMGGMIGSGTSAMLIAAGIGPKEHLGLLGLLLALLMLFGLRPVLHRIPEGAAIPHVSNPDGETPATDDKGGSTFILPNRDLLLMIFIGLCVSFSEGVAFDWSAVYLRDHLGAPEKVAALGFTCFSLTMMAMRFTGDVLIPRFGERRLLYFTAFTTMAALLLIIFSRTPAMGIGGFLLLGAGIALGAPILFNAAARVPGLAPGAGLATYSTFSFIGFLAGPPLIGLIGEKYSLPVGFALVAGLVLLSLLAIRRVRL